MKTDRPGFLSIGAIIAAVIATLVITISALASGGSMFSPGALNAHPGKVLGAVSSHADIAGNCGACHVAPWDKISMDDRCSYCHVNVALEMLDPTSVHGKMEQIDPQAQCRTCHPEHTGPDGLLTVLEGWRFPHEVARFSLKSHQLTARKEPFLCADCHGMDVTQFNVLTCAQCHISINMDFMVNHEASFGDRCLECHDGIDRYGHDFDHNKFAFKLEGRHAGLACLQCHVQAATISALQATSQDCLTCHLKDDAHKGSLGPDCKACHTPTGWKPSTFDHNRSDFKLTGAHAPVACDLCHVNGVFKGTPKDCFSCHKQIDPHLGQFGTVCESCHTTQAWKPALFDHDITGFKLIGSHKIVDCKACHINGIFANTPGDCYSCHAAQDAHQGRFGTDCGACHQPTQWSAAQFDHNATAFPLIGRHVSVSCLACHGNGAFKGTPRDCFACHARDDNHNGQLGTNCATCHVPAGWNISIFDHNTTAFPLTGQHTQLACTLCHQSGQFKIPTDCAACHGEPVFHMGAFGANCTQCHTTDGWSPAQFIGTHFAALGQNFLDHHAATCKTCHTNTVHDYTCLACHESDPLSRGNDVPVPAGTAVSTEAPGANEPSVFTSITPSNIQVGDTSQAVIRLNNVPAQSYTSLEFTCTYDPALLEVSNISVGDLFGPDAVSGIFGPENGSFILAVAGSQGRKVSGSGTVFIFNAKGLQAGTTNIECKARVSEGQNVLHDIGSLSSTMTIAGAVPTSTELTDATITGRVLATKPVTILLHNPDNSVAATGITNQDGTFNLIVKGGTFTITASAEGFLSAQGSITVAGGGSLSNPVVSLTAGDMDGNGVIDQMDLLTVGMNYNSVTPTAADLTTMV